MSLEPVKALLEAGVRERIFPSAQAAVVHQGKSVLEVCVGEASASTVYDLGSLTKLATAAAFIALWQRGAVGPQTLVSRFFPEGACASARVTLADLLYHRSGLPDFVPFYAAVMRAVPELLTPPVPAGTRQEVRREVVLAASRTGLARPRGESAVYSDVGFILLGEALTTAGNKPLDLLFRELVFRPLGFSLGFHRLSDPTGWKDQAAAPTGARRPREPAAGQKDFTQALPSAPSPAGEVEDDNAWVMDGVAGHAGLFGTAGQVARLGQAILEELAGANRIATAALWERALAVDETVAGSTRALGFDTPSPQGSSAGRYLGKRAPGAFGHLGFTGTSLWVDRERQLTVALLTNCTRDGRVHQPRIREFRPRFHDQVVEALQLI